MMICSPVLAMGRSAVAADMAFIVVPLIPASWTVTISILGPYSSSCLRQDVNPFESSVSSTGSGMALAAALVSSERKS
ncbi:hypothetical protein D3C77_297370 [compost metagenome]